MPRRWRVRFVWPRRSPALLADRTWSRSFGLDPFFAEATALPRLGDPQIAIEGEVHRGHEAIDAAQEVPSSEIYLQECAREFQKYAWCHYLDTACFKVKHLRVSVAVE